MVSVRPFAKFVIGLTLGVSACSQAPQVSTPLVTDVTHSDVKRQSIGNCWLYAHASWLESLLLTESGQQQNVSESYWTWWHWFDQISGSGTVTEVTTGGNWFTSTSIIQRHGWVLESEFIPDEGSAEMSTRQREAMNQINAALREGGELARPVDRRPENVRRVLDRAFGTDMAAAEAVSRAAADTVVSHTADGTPVSLAQALGGTPSTRWNFVRFPGISGQGTLLTDFDRAAQKRLMKRVLRALNDKQPVVMSLMINFNLLDRTDGSFRASLLNPDWLGSEHDFGGHMVVLEDYSVTNVPGYGELGEGDMDADAKAAALEGDIRYLVSKNSWGTNRPDRGITDGYTRFEWDYLTQSLPWMSAGGSVRWGSGASAFVLPPGY